MKRATALLVTMMLAFAATFLAPASAGAAEEQQMKPKRPISLTYDQIGSSIKVKLSGQAADYKKKTVVLQKLNGKKFVKVQAKKSKNNGKFSFVVTVPRDGKKHTWRVETKGDGSYKKTQSKPVKLYWT